MTWQTNHSLQSIQEIVAVLQNLIMVRLPWSIIGKPQTYVCMGACFPPWSKTSLVLSWRGTADTPSSLMWLLLKFPWGVSPHENWMRAYLFKSPRCWILDSFEWNKHRCTYVHFEEFISSSCSHIAVQVESEYLNIPGFVISLHTHAWIDLRRHGITLRCHTINRSWIGCELLLSRIVIDER